jgi:hypothetical protein
MLYGVDTGLDEAHLGLYFAHLWVESQQVVSLVDAKTEEQTEDNCCHYTGCDREYARKE